MLWRFRKPIKVDFARRRDPHALEPSANKEATIKGEPNDMKEQITVTLDGHLEFIYPHLNE